MKSPTIADLEPGQLATGVFLVLSKEVRQKKGSGDPYLLLTLGDRAGDIEARMWDNVENVIDTFDRDDFVKVKCLPQIFHNRLQVTIHTLQRVAASDVDPADFFPASARDPEEMFSELRGVIAGIGNPHLRGLLTAVFDDGDIAARYKRAPAAKTIHHAWLGGLIEHVLTLCSLCKAVAPHYKHIDLDLLLTGAILHDIGKIEELSYERGFNYSDVGQLIGHIQIGLRIVGAKMDLLPDFPPRLRVLVDHLILSHHGALEFGSPKVPMVAEAMLLHHLDNLDSKVEAMRVSVEKDRLVEGNWTSFVSSLDRPVLKKERYLDPPPPAPARLESRPAAVKPDARPSPASGVLAEKLRAALSGGD